MEPRLIRILENRGECHVERKFTPKSAYGTTTAVLRRSKFGIIYVGYLPMEPRGK